jgi:hypothetical protein
LTNFREAPARHSPTSHGAASGTQQSHALHRGQSMVCWIRPWCA